MEDFKTDEEILKFAIDREVQANQFFVALAERMAEPQMRQVFESFAEEELEHKAKLELEMMKIGKVVPTNAHADEFRTVEPMAGVEFGLSVSYKDALTMAIDKEKVSFRLYADLIPMVGNEESREVLLSLAEEEAKHKARFEIEYDMAVKRQ
jgi:rubrerythrin